MTVGVEHDEDVVLPRGVLPGWCCLERFDTKPVLAGVSL